MENTKLFNAEGRELAITEVMSMFKEFTLFENVTRVEVIDDNGRNYVNWNSANKVKISFQDDEKTMKILITRK